MRRSGRLSATCLPALMVLATTSCCSLASDPPTERPLVPSSSLSKSIDVLAHRALERGPIAGLSIAVLRDGRRVHAAGYGSANLDGSREVRAFGEHYFLFSGAPEEQLASWITPQLREVLTRHRLWSIAAHDGVIFLCRGSSREGVHEIESFLIEGEELLAAMLAAR